MQKTREIETHGPAPAAGPNVHYYWGAHRPGVIKFNSPEWERVTELQSVHDPKPVWLIDAEHLDRCFRLAVCAASALRDAGCSLTINGREAADIFGEIAARLKVVGVTEDA